METEMENRPMTELDMLRMKMNQKTDESLESTRRMVGLVDESQKAGASTLEQLQCQGDQLRRIDANMDIIQADVRDAERNMDQLDKCCGLCVCPWNRKRKQPPARVFTTQPSSGGFGGGGERSMTSSKVYTQAQPVQSGQYIQRITNDAREDEMEQNLHYVSNTVQELRYMATDMNQEIRTHNQMLERISDKTAANQESLNAAQKHADRIVGQTSKKSDDSVMPSGTKALAAKMLLS